MRDDLMTISRRKFLAASTALTANFAMPNVLSASAPVASLVLCGGQSNSLAWGTNGIPFPNSWMPTDKVKIWSVAHQNFEIYVPGAAVDWSGFWGPEAQYILERHAAKPDEQLFIYKQNGGSMAELSPFSTTGFWQAFMTQIISGNAVIAALGFTPVADAMLLTGGETDAVNWPVGSATYRYNCSSFLNAIRTTLGAPQMRAIICRIYPIWDPPGFVRASQQAMGSLPLNAWVDADDISKTSDGGHSDAPGTVEVGHRMWQADMAILR
jgi:hypothetical protein